jgi:IS5 family transposase
MGHTGRVMRHLRRQLDVITVTVLRERVIAKLALVSQILHPQPKGLTKSTPCMNPKSTASPKEKRGCATSSDESSAWLRLWTRGMWGMRSSPGAPYDGHILSRSLEQVTILRDQRPELAVVDRGYRGHGEEKTRVLISGMHRGLKAKLIADLRRRSAIEAEFRHRKTDGRLSRGPLKGTFGDAIFAVPCAYGHNRRDLLLLRAA